MVGDIFYYKPRERFEYLKNGETPLTVRYG